MSQNKSQNGRILVANQADMNHGLEVGLMEISVLKNSSKKIRTLTDSSRSERCFVFKKKLTNLFIFMQVRWSHDLKKKSLFTTILNFYIAPFFCNR